MRREIQNRQGPGALDRDRPRGSFLVVPFFFLHTLPKWIIAWLMVTTKQKNGSSDSRVRSGVIGVGHNT